MPPFTREIHLVMLCEHHQAPSILSAWSTQAAADLAPVTYSQFGSGQMLYIQTIKVDHPIRGKGNWTKGDT